MKALVKGGVGFIGSHLVDLLISQDCEVVLIDNLATCYRSQLPKNVLFLKDDAGNDEILARALPGCDAAFHLAAVSSVQDSLNRPIEVHNTNLTATLALLEAAVRHKVPRFVTSLGHRDDFPSYARSVPSSWASRRDQALPCGHQTGVYAFELVTNHVPGGRFRAIGEEVKFKLFVQRGLLAVRLPSNSHF